MTPSKEGQSASGFAIAIPNLAGLHARPAALLAARAKGYQSDVRLVRNFESVNAKSVVAIMGLGAQHLDLLRVDATGPDAVEAVESITKFLERGCGENQDEVPSTPDPAAPATPDVATARSNTSPHSFSGVCASPGLAVGRIVQFRPARIEVAETGGTPALEKLRFVAALQVSRAQIEALKFDLDNTVQAKILDAHLELLDDPDLSSLTLQGITQRKSAEFAWNTAFLQHATRIESLTGAQNALLRERGNDIRDVGRRVVSNLCDIEQSNFELPTGAILIADELTPSDTASFDRRKLLGFCTRTGGATSHVAILARSFGIPAVCGIDPGALALENGAVVILDGTDGVLHGKPSDHELLQAQGQIQQLTEKHLQDVRNASKPAITLDGHHIAVVANVRNAQDAREAIANGADGVGLLRSEFLFDGISNAPSEEEQAAAYTAVANALGKERSLVVRTLDVGGDKPLTYLPLAKEENPFLGLRGVRVSLDQPALFRTQLRAILRAAGNAKLHIMFPMIATLEEFREARAILSEEAARTGTHGVQVGLMIEIPSAAVLSEQFAREADFFSIGTNDLTQYTLAMDRGHPKLASKADGLHPSVLKMIALACQGAHAHGKWVGVCGGLASDVSAVPVLIGLGVSELSASVPAIPAIKSIVNRISMEKCRCLAQEVIQRGTVAEVRARLTAFFTSTNEE